MIRLVATASILLTFMLSACRSTLPDKSSEEYASAVRSFYVGLAAMQAADDLRAKKELENTVRLLRGEPAAWANLGILQMRQRDFDAAFQSLEKAKNLAPDNGQIYANLAVLEIQRGNFEQVKLNLQRAIEVDPADVKALFALAAEFEREGNDAEALAINEKISQVKPNNLAVVLEIVRLSAKRNEVEKVNAAFARIVQRNGSWEKEITEQYELLKTLVEKGNTREVAQRTAFFRNVLLRLPEFRSTLEEVKYSNTLAGEPFLRPLKLPVPDFSPAAADHGLKFDAEKLSDDRVLFNKTFFSDGDSAPKIVSANETELKIGDTVLPVANVSDLQTIDIDYDFRNDFVVAGEKGLQFFSAGFVDITAQTKLSSQVLQAKVRKLFVFDVEIDGDLDLILAIDGAPPIVLQNNGDGSFKELKKFAEAKDLNDFLSADFDEDGDMDAAFLTKGGALMVFSNERGGQFVMRRSPVDTPLSAIAVADTNGDGKLDLNLLRADGVLVRATDKDDGKNWETSEIVQSGISGVRTLLIQDFDNNGANDFLIANKLWLTDRDGKLVPTTAEISGEIFSAADLNGDGKLDLTGVDADRKPARFINRGTKNYRWLIIRPRAARAEGDQRVNSFGIGGEMEIRSGLLAQKRTISSPQIHFGLGEQTAADLLRVIWGNGFVQAEFDLDKDQQILVRQRLTGSCPHLFAWNGKEFQLVKDAAPLGTSLGLKVTEKDVLPVTQTEEWYKISGEQLVPKDGFYELRITDELWESYYVDRYSLFVVDHEADTEIFANELYPIPVPLRLHTTGKPRPFAQVTDENGDDVANLVAELDETYLNTFEDGRYQGVAKDHFVELELPDDVKDDEQINIIADGWLHPTDTSLNVAISQGTHEKPKSLSLDVLDESGSWKNVKDDFGVPAGKLKTIVVELPRGTRRCRLRTNMEIFWDRLAWAASTSDAANTLSKIELSSADLRFRGFSVIDKKDDSSPEIPDYERIATTIERWRSIEGYYTRYGDILELLERVDDRYAIVGSGDEMILKFREIPPVKQGFKRDFVLIGNGWIKEGDYNNVFSKTVLPLPTRANNDYSRRPTVLEDDPVYRKNKADWVRFHTRYVAPDSFRNAMR
jgi:Tfp pilus assembly protein PilF